MVEGSSWLIVLWHWSDIYGYYTIVYFKDFIFLLPQIGINVYKADEYNPESETHFLLITHHSLLITHCSLLNAHHSLLNTHH